MKTHIYTNSIYGLHSEDTDMNPDELCRMRKRVLKDIMTWFDWKSYGENFRHLLYYAEYEGEAYIWICGHIMDEQTFDETIAMRKEISYAGVIHRR